MRGKYVSMGIMARRRIAEVRKQPRLDFATMAGAATPPRDEEKAELLLDGGGER